MFDHSALRSCPYKLIHYAEILHYGTCVWLVCGFSGILQLKPYMVADCVLDVVATRYMASHSDHLGSKVTFIPGMYRFIGPTYYWLEVGIIVAHLNSICYM